ncbi:hypothetical protein B0J17DRAFT_722962 [Rhizoctonia solani]|nr:hypothetical protein B0J17DRAFT_722962 [Rhizoctonia solani]
MNFVAARTASTGANNVFSRSYHVVFDTEECTKEEEQKVWTGSRVATKLEAGPWANAHNYSSHYRHTLSSSSNYTPCASQTSPLPEAKESKAQPFYLAEPPQEFDEEGKELGPDAQVWRTYVKEADRVDEELVDGWNKSMDVNLIFVRDSYCTLIDKFYSYTYRPPYSLPSPLRAFVIESYKNLKQDPADVSAQTLLVISQTLSSMNNGSQTTNVPPIRIWKHLRSKHHQLRSVVHACQGWCLEFMSGRIGPPGSQARRRQRRWDGVVGWKMNEVLVVLPSLIHLSLLLFAVGLCVFLWDVHYGVAIPVVTVTALAAGAYFACTILPYIDEYCPYGTVLSRLYKQFSNRHVQSTRDTVTQDETTSRALHWMIVNCETPRSVDVALQSLAGSDGDYQLRCFRNAMHGH